MNLIRLQQSFFQYGTKIVMQTTKLVLDQYSVICFEFQRAHERKRLLVCFYAALMRRATSACEKGFMFLDLLALRQYFCEMSMQI